MNYPIKFFKPDDPLAGESLAKSLESTEQPVLGLIVKVKQEGEHETIVNWSFADPILIKSMAVLCLPGLTVETVEKQRSIHVQEVVPYHPCGTYFFRGLCDYPPGAFTYGGSGCP